MPVLHFKTVGDDPERLKAEFFVKFSGGGIAANDRVKLQNLKAELFGLIKTVYFAVNRFCNKT